jgi:hypothetical protein
VATSIRFDEPESLVTKQHYTIFVNSFKIQLICYNTS